MVLDSIPPRFRRATINNLRPQLDRHPGQAEVVEALRSSPLDSYLFCGVSGSGKSHFGWCVARYSLGAGRRLVACNVEDLLGDYVKLASPEVNENGLARYFQARVTSEDLQVRGVKYCLFLQELDKPKPTEFASKMLFNLIDAAYNYEHQLVVTSQVRVSELQQHWSRYGEKYGTGMMRRITEMCAEVRMFREAMK